MKSICRDSNFHIFSLILIIGFINLKISRFLLMIFIGYSLMVVYSNIKKFIKNNIFQGKEKRNVTNYIRKNIDIASLFFVSILIFICFLQVYKEYNTAFKRNYDVAYTTFDDKETYAINKNIFFEHINVEISLISISKIDHGTIVDVAIYNKSNDNIKPTLFNFNIIDKENNVKYRIVVDDYNVVKKGEKKYYVLAIEDFPSDCTNITLEVDYDNFIDYNESGKVDIELY